MNIRSNLNSIAPIAQEAAPARVAAPAANAAESARPVSSAPVLEGDETHLSQAALLASAVSSVSDARLDKVAAVQQALAAGSYAVSPSAVAGKLIDHLLQS
jgi:negative regulator of flagellin synthesis FlgM